MLHLRNKRTQRDRKSGLIFPWRMPDGSTTALLLAAGVVAAVSAGLAAGVRVSVGEFSQQQERRGTLVLVPSGEGWGELETLAREAGPMPLRPDPAHDPAIRGMLHDELAATVPPGYRYEPSLRSVTVGGEGGEVLASAVSGILPPLPIPDPPSAKPGQPDLIQLLVLSSGLLRASVPNGDPPTSLVRGNRYLLEYDPRGHVLRVILLSSTAEQLTGSDEAGDWLRRVVIEGGAKTGGWTSVEIAGGS